MTDIETSLQARFCAQTDRRGFAFLLFSIRIIGTGLLALPVRAGSAAYAMVGTFEWKSRLELAPKLAKKFYGSQSPVESRPFPRERTSQVGAPEQRHHDRTKALARCPFCGAVPKPAHGDQTICIAERFRGFRARCLIRICCRTTGSPNAAPLR
ncbi:hypothetical protein [Paraburkholderia hospita]|uniref:hypothetical protein n=1 Tax=Paraburkholderia hospita TaxID=169430 RepID=UPI002448A560|nr:hypothetical protein [Paraburkholderia hospita]